MQSGFALDEGKLAQVAAVLPPQIEREVRDGLTGTTRFDALDLERSRLFIEQQVTRKGEQSTTNTENSVRVVPVPQYLVPALKRWKLECAITARGWIFPSDLNEHGVRGPIEADHLLRNILRRALRRAGLPRDPFSRHAPLGGQLMHEAACRSSVRGYFAHLVKEEVSRSMLPGIHGCNFVMQEALAGGGPVSLRMDSLGKAMAQMLLDFELHVPTALAAQLQRERAT